MISSRSASASRPWSALGGGTVAGLCNCHRRPCAASERGSTGAAMSEADRPSMAESYPGRDRLTAPRGSWSTMSTWSSRPLDSLLAHRQWVRDLARRLCADESAADDLEQQTWLSALRRPPQGG